MSRKENINSDCLTYNTRAETFAKTCDERKILYLTGHKKKWQKNN